MESSKSIFYGNPGENRTFITVWGGTILTICEDLKRKIEHAFAVFNTEAFNQRLTTQQDVQVIDSLVDEVVMNLKGQFEREFLEQLARELAEERERYAASEQHVAEPPASVNDSSLDSYQAAA